MTGRRFNNSNKERNRFSSVAPREVVRDQQYLKRYRDREKTLIDSSGTYHIWLTRNLSQVCYCHNRRNDSGHSNCPTCFGTGYLFSYDKYGYKTFTFGRTYPELLVSQPTIEGWGYQEVFDTDTVVTTPFIDTSSFKDLTFFEIDEFESVVQARVEVSYDDVIWCDLDEDLDLSQGQARFRMTLDEGQSRYLRLRFRELEFTDTRDIELPDDVYIQVSSAEKQSGEVVQEREKADIISEADAWSLAQVKSDDILIDVSGMFSGLRFSDEEPARYQLYGVRTGVHGPLQGEHRRDFSIRYIPKESYLHNYYRIPA